VVCYGAQFVTKRAEAGRGFMKAYLQGVRDYNDALKDGRIAGPNAEEVIDAIARYSVTKDRDLAESASTEFYELSSPNIAAIPAMM